MVKAWYIKELPSNEREFVREINLDELNKAAGVIYYKVDANNYRSKVDEIREKYEYKREDIIELGPSMEDFEAKEKKFATEHLHIDEEVRFAIDGQGILEIRDNEDNWIRIHVEKDDFLILPEKIYHRFFFVKDENTGKTLPITFLRCFKDNSPYHMAFRSSEQ